MNMREQFETRFPTPAGVEWDEANQCYKCKVPSPYLALWMGWTAAHNLDTPEVSKSQFLTDVITAAGMIAHGKQDKKFARRLSDEASRLQLLATTCPGHGRSECVSCCWPKSSAEDFRKLHLTVPVTTATEARVRELADLLTLAKHHVPLTDPLRGLVNANLMQHRLEQDPWADFKDAAPVPAGYTVDMGTAAADGYRDAVEHGFQRVAEVSVTDIDPHYPNPGRQVYVNWLWSKEDIPHGTLLYVRTDRSIGS